MNKAIIVVPLAAILTAACASVEKPTAKAAEVERLQCESGSAEQRDLALLRSAQVLEASPLYSHVISTGGETEQSRVDGAKIVVRPPEGVSAERMTRVLQCHAAQVLLGQQEQFASDPFWLPGAWLNIEVKPELGNYAVTLEADSVANNIKLAQRAMSFARADGFAKSTVVQ